jgi:DNA-binding LacI/PurR family transcriptional regulator
MKSKQLQTPILTQIQPVQGYAKYKQTKDLIYNYILRSGTRPGEKVCTEAVLIAELSISVTTARRALGELVREGILVRKVGKGTFLKHLAPERKTSTVLLLGQNSWQFLREDVYYGRIVSALGSTLRASGFRQVVLINDWGHDPEAELQDIQRHDPAAIVFPYSRFDEKPFILALATLGVPLMIYGHPLDGLVSGQIHFDERQGGAMAAKYLIARGYREMAVILPPAESPAGNARIAGFVETINAHKECRLTGQIAAASFGETDGYNCIDGLLSNGSRPRAIFCGGDLLAYGAIKRLEELGLAVPNDVAIVGYGDFEASSFYHPRLTTVRMGLEQMGVEIGKWVTRVAQEPDTQSGGSYVRMLPVELIVRDTA